MARKETEQREAQTREEDLAGSWRPLEAASEAPASAQGHGELPDTIRSLAAPQEKIEGECPDGAEAGEALSVAETAGAARREKAPAADRGRREGPAANERGQSRLLAALECVLFAAGEPLPVERLAQVLECDATEIPGLCARLNERLTDTGLHVVQLAGGYTMATRPEYAEYVQRLLEPERERLSMAALETLAIIAYRQPITRPEIDALRGVNSAAVVTSLLEKGLIRICGRKEAPGRPFLFETTAHFLSTFGLADLSQLPRVDLPEIGASPQPRLLGQALEELTTAEEEPESEGPSRFACGD